MVCLYTRNQNQIILISLTVDTARGQGKDYSAAVVIDITDPHIKVVKFRNNIISPMVYPTVIEIIGKEI
jgi:hypothetical protein